jgi:hypothetical protein
LGKETVCVGVEADKEVAVDDLPQVPEHMPTADSHSQNHSFIAQSPSVNVEPQTCIRGFRRFHDA